MKSVIQKYLLLVVASGIGITISAQKIGIGTTAPQYALDVNGPVWLRHMNDDSTAGLWLEGTAGANRSFWGMLTNNKAGIWGSGGGGWGLTTDLTNRNVGIGTINPAYRLDVNGRMRIKNTATNTAGFTLVGTSSQQRSFIGTMNDNHLGIYSSVGIGWFFSMNVNDGNTGIGLANPTAKLDVNTSMRLRGGSPKTGSILVSSDANGNAVWQYPWGFDAMGTQSGSTMTVKKDQWQKVYYGRELYFNAGGSYDYINGWFTTPVNGIYDLHLHIGFNENYSNDKTYIRIMQLRNGVTTELLRYDFNQVYDNHLNPQTNELYKDTKFPSLNYTTGGILLNELDRIWAEVFVADRIISNTGSSVSETYLDYWSCRMTGSLVVKL